MIVHQYPEISNDIDGVFALGFGFDKNEVYNHVLEPLLYRAKELGIPTNASINKDCTLEQMKSAIEHYSGKILKIENSNQKPSIKNYQDTQTKFNTANKFLAELANNCLDVPKIIHRTRYEGYKETSKSIELSDGRFVHAMYDANKKITEITIKADNDCAVIYTMNDGGPVNNDFTMTYTPLASGGVDYNFNAIAKVVQKLFKESN